MKPCANCNGQELRPVLTKQGVEIDYCDRCGGIWLDKGEVFHFAKTPEPLSRELDKALGTASESEKLSPRARRPMVEIAHSAGLRLDYCRESGGLWFDNGELQTLLRHDAQGSVDIDPQTARQAAAGPTSNAHLDGQRGAALLALPNLFLRSMVTLVGLYALLTAVLIAAVEFLGLELEAAIMGGLLAMIIQFLIGPWLMDLSLRWLYRMNWVEPQELPDHLRQFVDRVVTAKGIRFPRFGIIDDGAPQAFTYGHAPSNARIVLSRGLLEMLDPEESEAVVAHEIGHAVHWDMFLMSVAQLVPLILYYIYRTLIRMRTSGSGKNKGQAAAVRLGLAIAAYLLYIVSQYIVLWFSRTREYHADRFAGEATGNPSALASALVKIAYGLAGQRREEEEGRRGGQTELTAVRAMGIFDGATAEALAVSSFSEASQSSGAVNTDSLKGAMRWDLWNPWAKWYELNSTHPLVANRLRYLSDQAVYLGREPYVVFDERKPESYWDEFAVDLGVYLLTPLVILGAALYWVHVSVSGGAADISPALAVMLIAFGVATLIKTSCAYRGRFFPEMSIAALLKKVKVSSVRPVPCTLKGTIVGRGVPGYIFSEDFIMRDETGIIFLDYRHPLGIWEMFFGLMRAGEYQNQEATVEGWYRRAPVPYIEIKSLSCNGEFRRSIVPTVARVFSLLLLSLGIVWPFLGIEVPVQPLGI